MSYNANFGPWTSIEGGMPKNGPLVSQIWPAAFNPPPTLTATQALSRSNSPNLPRHNSSSPHANFLASEIDREATLVCVARNAKESGRGVPSDPTAINWLLGMAKAGRHGKKSGRNEYNTSFNSRNHSSNGYGYIANNNSRNSAVSYDGGLQGSSSQAMNHWQNTNSSQGMSSPIRLFSSNHPSHSSRPQRNFLDSPERHSLTRVKSVGELVRDQGRKAAATSMVKGMTVMCRERRKLREIASKRKIKQLVVSREGSSGGGIAYPLK